MNCTCGVELRQFWIWRDANGTLHASQFRPTTGLEGSVMASTARDALVPVMAAGIPRHDVLDELDSSAGRQGRCSTTLTKTRSAPGSLKREPVTAQ
jgi:hypothetical protein